jgi:hypothetical protein
MVSAFAQPISGQNVQKSAALVGTLSYHHRLDVANLRSAVGREVGAQLYSAEARRSFCPTYR